MRELTKIFKGVNIPIELVDDENIFFTVSEVARKNSKNITDWKNSKRIKELVRSLEKSNGIKQNLIQEDTLGRTKIHRSLLMNFARFISVDFEIEADKILYDILTGKQKLIEAKCEYMIIENKKLENKLEVSGKIHKNQLEQKDKMITEAKRKAYAHSRTGNFQCATNILRATKANISIETFNKILFKNNYLSQKEVITKKYISNDKQSITSESGVLLIHYDTAIKVLKDYDVEFEEDDQLKMEF